MKRIALPHRITMTLRSFNSVSQRFCRIDGILGFVLQRYGNSSMTTSFFFSPYGSSQIARKACSQSAKRETYFFAGISSFIN